MRYTDTAHTFDTDNRAWRRFGEVTSDHFDLLTWTREDGRPTLLTVVDLASGDTFTVAVLDSLEVDQPHAVLACHRDGTLTVHGPFHPDRRSAARPHPRPERHLRRRDPAAAAASPQRRSPTRRRRMAPTAAAAAHRHTTAAARTITGGARTDRLDPAAAGRRRPVPRPQRRPALGTGDIAGCRRGVCPGRHARHRPADAVDRGPR
jgi:hypothetical protein